MNRNIIIGSVIGIVLIIAGGALFLSTHNSSKPAVSTNATSKTTATPQSTTAPMAKLSLKSLMGMSGNQQCTFSDDQSGTTGTTYISSGKMRGDISGKSGDTTFSTHMLSDGQTMYMWMDNQKTGYKTSVAAADTVRDQAQQKQTVDLNKQVAYSCSGWSVDASKFVVPTDITFTDFSGMMQKTGEMMQHMSPAPSGTMPNSQNACAACANLPADAQAQCKASLHCN